jgi:hypothetical protein
MSNILKYISALMYLFLAISKPISSQSYVVVILRGWEPKWNETSPSHPFVFVLYYLTAASIELSRLNYWSYRTEY